MAKSLRSKWRRKMRNIKRERYGKKELIRLKKMLGLPIDDETPTASADNVIEFGGDVEMKPEDEMTNRANGMSVKEVKLIHRMVREGSDCEDSEAEKEINEIMDLTSKRKLRSSYRPRPEKKREVKAKNVESKDEDMEHDQKRRRYNKNTMKDQNGQYPVWMNQKKIRTLAKKNRAVKKKEKKRLLKLYPRPVDKKTVQSDDSETDIDEPVDPLNSETGIQADSIPPANTSVDDTDMQPETIEID